VNVTEASNHWVRVAASYSSTTSSSSSPLLLVWLRADFERDGAVSEGLIEDVLRRMTAPSLSSLCVRASIVCACLCARVLVRVCD
jgi:hypothetical protein